MRDILDFEESAKYAKFGIICFKNGTKKSYFRPRLLNIEESKKETLEGSPKVEYELVPISNAELQKLGIIEESEQTDSEMDIEESADDSETDRKLRIVRETVAKEKADAEKEAQAKPNLTLSGDPLAVASAKKILEDAQAKQKGEPSKEELAEQVEDLSNKLSIIAEKQFMAKKAQLGCNDLEVTNPEALKMWQKGRETVETGRKHEVAAGSAPLNEFQLGQQDQSNVPLRQRRFSTKEEMVQELRKLAKGSDEQAREAESCLNELWLHGMKVWKNSSVRPEQNYSPPEEGEKISGNPTLVSDTLSKDTGESEIEKFGVRRGRGKDKRPWTSGQAQPSKQTKQESD